MNQDNKSNERFSESWIVLLWNGDDVKFSIESLRVILNQSIIFTYF